MSGNIVIIRNGVVDLEPIQNEVLGLPEINGGPGSGNFGHAGIPGQVGGSAAGGGSDGGKKGAKEKESKASMSDTDKADMAKFDKTIKSHEKYANEVAAKGDKDSAKTFHQDVEDLKGIKEAVKEGDFKYAARLMDSLDSAVRDMIPPRMYSKVQKAAGRS